MGDFFRKLLAIVLCVCIFGGVLYLGGFSFDSFGKSIEMKDPEEVFDKYIPDFSSPPSNTSADVETSADVDDSVGDNTNGDNNNSLIEGLFPSGGVTTSKNGWFPDDLEFNKPVDDEFLNSSNSGDKTTVNINNSSTTVDDDSVGDFIKWLENNYNKNIPYNKTLKNKDDLNALINSITIIDKLPNMNTYNRNDFENPVVSYTLNGKKVNRNDYAWKTSPFFNEQDFTYTCPYTGIVFTDLDDNKADNDFGNLDYDHIVPLKSAYLRGGYNWTAEQMNEYAYNQWVGVDVQNSANRSKSDKGLEDYLPPCNTEDYCYSFLMICSKYNLAMTQNEIDICSKYIGEALDNNIEVTHLGGF